MRTILRKNEMIKLFFVREHLVIRILFLTVLFVPWVNIHSETQVDSDRGTESMEASNKAFAKLRKLQPEMLIENVKPTPVPGVFMGSVGGGQYLYAAGDGRHIFVGELYEVTDSSLVSLSEKYRSKVRLEVLASLEKDELIIFTPQSRVSSVKAVVTVFTDVDCGYCRKLHQQMSEYHKRGIEVRYLAYPRSGIGTDSYHKYVSAWCSKNPQVALTKLKNGKTIDESTCVNPVAAQYELGQMIGISGTPSILLPDGRMLPGLVPPDGLAAELGI